MTAKASQCERLLTYLERRERINPLVAWVELGIYRLGARIFDLKAKGYAIESRRLDVVNRFGEVTQVAEYTLRAPT